MSFFSIILPTYNRAQTLERALDSVYAQTDSDYELILVDDGSTDSTQELCENHALAQRGQLKYIYQANRGVSAARNLGLQNSSGDWVCFLDSDDEWLPEKLVKQREMAADHPDCQVLHGEEIWIRHGVRVNPMKKHQKLGGMIFKDCLELCRISPSTVSIQKNLLVQEGGFREDFPVCEDYELWLRLTSQSQVAFTKTALIKKYGGHQDQLSRKYVAMDYWRIKALLPCLKWPHLKNSEKIAVANVLIKKAKILRKGCLKHQNLKILPEIEEALSIAQNFANQF